MAVFGIAILCASVIFLFCRVRIVELWKQITKQPPSTAAKPINSRTAPQTKIERPSQDLPKVVMMEVTTPETVKTPTLVENRIASTLMPPPSRPTTFRKPFPSPTSTTNSLRIPSNGPLPNRNPNAKTTASTFLGPGSAQRAAPNQRKKVILEPGHSPLDWATLTKSGTNLSGVDGFLRVTPSQLAWNNGRKDRPAWSIWQGKVYNITPYLPFHPGGKGELMRGAGKDSEKLFLEIHPWVNWENMLGDCLVGYMVSEGEEHKESELDEMD